MTDRSVWKKIRVTEDKKALDVFVPNTDDRIEAKDLEDYAIGKTKEDFKTKEIFNRKRESVDKREAAEILKEAKAYSERKAAGTKKYY
jgi:hypothetical protein